MYLLHWELERRFAVSKLHGDAGTLNLTHNIVQLLGFLQHLSVTAAKLAQDAVGHMGDAVSRIPQCTPQGLETFSTVVGAQPRDAAPWSTKQNLHHARPHKGDPGLGFGVFLEESLLLHQE